MPEIAKRKPWWPIAISYVAAWTLYVFSQPPLTANPSPDQVILGRLSSAFGFGVVLVAGIVAGSIGGLIYKAKGRPFPWARILWASLTIAIILGLVLTFGAWKAHSYLSSR